MTGENLAAIVYILVGAGLFILAAVITWNLLDLIIKITNTNKRK